MSTNPPAAANPSGPMPTVTPPPTAGAARLVVLLGLLGLAIGALIYDYTVAAPGVEAAEKRLNDFADARNRLGVKESGPITPEEIHKEIGMKPTLIEKHPDQNYMVEYYCWWGRVPLINLRRHFLALVYIGDKTMRFSSHHKNETPPGEALPILDQPQQATGETPALPAAAGTGGSAPTSSPADAAPEK